jgi:hypothetical protein
MASRLRASDDSLPASRSRSASTRSRCLLISVSVFCEALSSAVTSSSPIAGASRVTSVSANIFCWSRAILMPKPNSALSSNSELAHVGPRPCALLA